LTELFQHNTSVVLGTENKDITTSVDRICTNGTALLFVDPPDSIHDFNGAAADLLDARVCAYGVQLVTVLHGQLKHFTLVFVPQVVLHFAYPFVHYFQTPQFQ